jgi:hypothetical protein
MKSALGIVIAAALLAWPWQAGAVSQWSRKYNEPCSTCHTIFPRVNYYGERYLRNGYQKPDAEEGDGDKVGKKPLGDKLVIGKVEDWLGARLNVTPIAAKTNAITVNGEKRTQTTLGNPNWLQLFVSGTIYKDVSIFIENEFTGSAFKFNWYYLGFHNLAGDLANVQIGNISPLLFASYQNRLPVFPMVRNEAMRIKGSALAGTGAGASADALDTSSARPGIQYYGEAAPLVWWAGISPGSKGSDVNQFLNYWVGTRFEIVEDWESAFEGSSVSLFYQGGTDTTATANPQLTNDYVRISPSLNVRMGKLDVQAGYVYGRDDNITLTAVPTRGRFDGWTALVAYVGDSSWVPGIQWDVTDIEEPAPVTDKYVEMNRVTPNLTYMLRENLRVTAYFAVDMLKDSPTHPDEQHEFILNIRTMF